MDNMIKQVVAVVEDDESILDALKMVLENQNWRVLAYTSGEACIDDIGNHRPDCMLLDPHLPGINGIEVVRSLPPELVPEKMPVIVLTAHPNSPQVAELCELGAHELLIKPITEEILLGKIRANISA